MNFLKIQNQGLLDIRLVALMGGSTKSSDEFKIGQFGTGLKYVLAYLFRSGLQFKIFIGEKEVELSIEKEEIMEETFEIVCIEGNRTSITTKMGLDWLPWMIVRELYSNALDEGGELYEITEEVHGEEGKTTFYIEANGDFLKVYNDWNKYFIVGNVPMYEDEKFAVHPSGQTLKIYKQGILIHENKNRSSVFNYDLKNADINELREYKGIATQDIYHALCALDEKTVRYFLENVSEEEHYEGGMDYNWDFIGDGYFKESWTKAIGNAKLIHKEAVDSIKARGVKIDLSDTITVPKKIYTALTKKFEGIGALRVADKIGDFFEVHNEGLAVKVEKCVAYLSQAGYVMDPELKFVFGVFGDRSVFARINIDKKEILISERHAERPMFDTCAMLVEENEHYKTGFVDCSREFQQNFIDLFVKTLLQNSEIEL